MQFRIAVRTDLKEHLDAVVAAARVEEHAWWKERRREVSRIPEAADRRAALDALYAERQRRRAAGECPATMSSLLAPAVAVMLADRGWDRDWPEPPAGALETPGRRWGVALEDDRGGQARLAVELPDDLGDRLRRAVYWSSREATRKLQEWDDKFGSGPAAMLGVALGVGPRGEHMDTKRELRAQIVTVGDVLRAAAYLAAQQHQGQEAAEAEQSPPQ